MIANTAPNPNNAQALDESMKFQPESEASASGGLPPEYDAAIAQLRDLKDKSAVNVNQSRSAAHSIGENILKIPVKLEIVLGSLTMPVSQLMAMTKGEIMSLDRNIGDGLEIHVNGSRIGTGELVIADDHTGLLGVRIVELDHEA